MRDDLPEWVPGLAYGTVASVAGTYVAALLTEFDLLRLGAVFAVACIASALSSGWHIRRRHECHLRAYVDTLRKLNAAFIDSSARTNPDRDMLVNFLNMLCDAPELPHLSAGVVFLVDQEDADWLVAEAWSSQKGETHKRFFVGTSMTGEAAHGPGAAGTAFTSRAPQIVRFDRRGRPDHPLYQQFRLKPTSTYRSFVACPVGSESAPRGVLSLESSSRRGITRRDLPYYELIADCLGGALACRGVQ